MRDVAETTQMDPSQLRVLLEGERVTEQIRVPALPREWTLFRLVLTSVALAFALLATVLTLF